MKKKVAFIINFFGNDYISHRLLNGIDSASSAYDLDCFCLITNPRKTEKSGNIKIEPVLHKFIEDNDFDGFIVWSSGLWGTAGPVNEEADTIYTWIGDRACVNIGSIYKNIPTISIDNYHGIYELCSHMIEDHNCKNMAFIRGPVQHKEAETRFQAYRDCLEKHNIKYNEDLVAVGNFFPQSGIDGIKTLIDERKSTFDSLISANDYMLTGAISELERRGLNVPEDIAAGGFDDIDESIIQKTPFTTVKQPFEKLGFNAIELVYKIISGENVENNYLVKSELIIRQSCGCPALLSFPESTYKKSSYAGNNISENIPEFSVIITQFKNKYAAEINALDALSINTDSLLDSFLKNITDDFTVSFKSTLYDEIKKTESSSDIQVFTAYIAALKTTVLDYYGKNKIVLDNIIVLIHLAQSAVSEHHVRLLSAQLKNISFEKQILDELNHNIMAAFDSEQLIQIITDIFRRFDIRQFYLALYKNPELNLDESRLVLAYKNGSIEIKPEMSEYATGLILPNELLAKNDRSSFVVIPLYYESHQLGFFVFGKGFLKGSIYTEIQIRLSATLQVSLLIREKMLLLENLEKRALILQQTAAKLKNSNRELQSFAYSASHDLREPLRKIRIFAERLKIESNVMHDGTSLDILSRMTASSERMSELLENLLIYSKITTKTNPFSRIDLNGTINDVLSDLEILIEQKHAAVIFSGLPCIDADPVQIRQLFQNLINNAIKFSKKNTTPRIDITSEIVNENSTKNCLINVKDNGIGIEEKYLDKIFGIFQRLHSDREYKGTGIGLAICKRITERHSGSISVKSTFGQGTTFIIRLPVFQLTNE